MQKPLAATFLGIALSSCGIAQQIMEQRKNAKIEGEMKAGYASCDTTFPGDGLRTKKLRCYIDVDNRVIRPNHPLPDLLDLFNAQKLSLLAKVERNEMSWDDARLEEAKRAISTPRNMNGGC